MEGTWFAVLLELASSILQPVAVRPLFASLPRLQATWATRQDTQYPKCGTRYVMPDGSSVTRQSIRGFPYPNTSRLRLM